MGKQLTRSVVIVALESLAKGSDDPEVKHGQADALLLSYVPLDVRKAYEAVKESAEWWASA